MYVIELFDEPRGTGAGFWRTCIGLLRGVVLSGAFALLLTTIFVQNLAEAEPLPPAWSGGSWQPGPEQYDVGLERDVSVRVSDGVVLRALIAYPTDRSNGGRATGPFPILLEQTPYYHAEYETTEAVDQHVRYFVSRGYIYVIAQVRGTAHSGGSFGFLSDREKQDGIELVDWAAHELANATGIVGLTGCSYAGASQYFTVARAGANSPIKAIAPAGVGPDFYREPFFRGGIPTGTTKNIFANVFANHLGTLSAQEFSSRVIAKIRSGGDKAYRRAFWKRRAVASTIPAVARSGIPVLIWSGWDDLYPISAPEAYTMLQNSWSSRSIWAPMVQDQAVTPRYQLIMAPGTHCSGGNGGPRDQATLKWFDTWLKDRDTGLQRMANPLQLSETGSSSWISASSYPMVQANTPYYLAKNGALVAERPRAKRGEDRLKYNPPSAGDAHISYLTSPFPSDASLVGPIALRINAKPSRASLALIAELYDVAPDGDELKLSAGAIIGGMHAGDEGRTWRDVNGHIVRPYQDFDTGKPLVPGRIIPIDIQMQSRVALIKEGHSLKLVLTTQSPGDACNQIPQKQLDSCLVPTEPQLKALRNGSYDILRTARFSSYLSLPLMPRHSVSQSDGE